MAIVAIIMRDLKDLWDAGFHIPYICLPVDKWSGLFDYFKSMHIVLKAKNKNENEAEGIENFISSLTAVLCIKSTFIIMLYYIK